MSFMGLTPWRWNERHSLARGGDDPFANLQREMNQFFRGFFDDAGLAGSSATALTAPKLDVSESDQEWRLAVELPGVKEEDLDVEFAGDLLRIRGEKKDEREDKQHNYHRVERTFGMFERVIPIPAEIDREHVQATFKNGVLEVTLPKSAPAPATQKIAVKPGA